MLQKPAYRTWARRPTIRSQLMVALRGGGRFVGRVEFEERELRTHVSWSRRSMTRRSATLWSSSTGQRCTPQWSWRFVETEFEDTVDLERGRSQPARRKGGFRERDPTERVVGRDAAGVGTARCRLLERMLLHGGSTPSRGSERVDGRRGAKVVGTSSASTPSSNKKTKGSCNSSANDARSPEVRKTMHLCCRGHCAPGPVMSAEGAQCDMSKSEIQEGSTRYTTRSKAQQGISPVSRRSRSPRPAGRTPATSRR